MALSKPSSTEPVYTPGTARGAKLAALLVDEGTTLVRNIFEDEVQKMNPPSLREQLKKHRRYLCGLRYLNPGQRKTLYPPGGQVPDTAQGFDISLLELLLKEIVCYELGRDAPYSGERDRLRRFRNDNYGHISSTELSEVDFDILWTELTDILVTLEGDRDKISEKLNSSIDPEQEKKHLELLEKLYKEDMEVKDLLLAQGESLQKGQEDILDQGKSLLKGQETLLDQGMGLKVGQDKLLAQGESLRNQGDSLKRGQDHLSETLSTQRKIQKKGLEEVLDGQQRLTKGQEEVKSLLAEVREAQSPGTNSGQQEDSSSRTGLPVVPNDVIPCLQDLYRTESAHVRPLPWCEDLNLHLGEVFTNLQLQRRDDRGRFQDTGTIVSLGDIYHSRADEDSDFNARAAVRKIRVEGDPGIGKSCSCQKLAYDWSCGKLDRFKAVFFLEMRHLAGNVKVEIFEQLLPKDTNTTPDQLWSYIQQNQDDVLFILDGLDELSQAARQVTDVVDLIQGKILRNCHVLVTSRPYHCVKDLEKCHQFYRIVGFSKKNSEDFIRKYFCKSPESASKLVKQLDSNRNLSEIVVNPLNSVLVCVVWEDNNDQLPSSKAELYEMIVISIAKRFCTKKTLSTEGDKLPPDIEAALRGLGKLSWEGLEKEQLQFNIAEVTKKYGTDADNMLTLGLLTRDYSFSRIKRTCLCAFLHKTFQEYMAAWYISGLFTGGSSREEGMKCLRSLFGLTKDIGIDKKLILDSRRKYEEVQDWLLLILGENANPVFDMFAEELNKAQTDEDMDALSFVCITWLGRTECAGVKMAEIVAPCLSPHATNCLGDFSEHYDLGDFREPYVLGDFSEYYDVGDFFELYDRRIDWFVGLAHVLTFHKKQTASNNRRVIQHLTVDCSRIIEQLPYQEKHDVLGEALSDYNALRSVTLLQTMGGIEDSCYSSYLLRPFIPQCGIGSLTIHINSTHGASLSLSNSFEYLSVAPRVDHIRVTERGNMMDLYGPAELEYDWPLADMIRKQNCLKSLRLEIDTWPRVDPRARGVGDLTATLQSISQHATLEEVEFELPRNNFRTTRKTEFNAVMINNVEMVIYNRHEMFEVDPMVHELTECITKNKVLKTLKLRWRLIDENQSSNKSPSSFYGVCSSESLSRLCSAIQENRTLETLEIDGMLFDSQSEGQAKVIAELLDNKPSNYKKLNITLLDCTDVDKDVSMIRADLL